jgi:hypothetical protein
MSETNIITSLDNMEVQEHDKFVVLKGKTQGDIVVTLGVEQIPWLHKALNHLYAVRANDESYGVITKAE